MADFVANFGGCNPHIQPMAERHRAKQTGRETMFSSGRRIYDREWRDVVLTWDFATLGTVESIVGLWHQTFGGVLTMRYTPDNSESAFDLRFKSPPVVTSTGPQTYAISVEAEEHIQQ